MKHVLVGALVLIGALPACSGSTSLTGSDSDSIQVPVEPTPGWVRVIGTLAHSAAVVPTQANRWEPFKVTVSTISTTGCIKDAGMEVMVWDSLARIVAYDSVPAPESGFVCPAVLGGVHHEATVRFTSSGEATVRVVGYTGFGAERRLDSLDFTVMVGP